MARKRSIKPEFFSDVDLADVSIEARYLYAGMWPWMDRQGVIEADARVHRVNTFPHDEKVTASKVQLWLNELVRAGFVLRFSWLGKELLFCPTFNTHQKLFPDEKARFNVSDELLGSLKVDAPLPATSTLSPIRNSIGSVSEPVRVEVEVEVRSTKNEEGEIFDFESLYKTWPRKRGKDEGMHRLKARIKTRGAYTLFATAVAHYLIEHAHLKTKKEYTPYWSSFVGVDGKEPWRDYIEKPDLENQGPETADQIAARLIAEHEGRCA